MNEEDSVVNFQNYDLLYFCFIPFKAFLSNMASSDGCKSFNDIDGQESPSHLTDEEAEIGADLSPKFNDKPMTFRSRTQISWLLAQHFPLSYLDFSTAFDKVPHEKGI